MTVNSFSPPKRTVAIIQARMGSSRLPGKVLLPFGEASMLAYLIARVRTARRVDAVVVATTTEPRDDAIVRECKRRGVECFRGSEYDVLGRYAGAASAFGADVIVRVTADNPFTDPGSIDRVVDHILTTGDQYALEDRLPVGTTGEALTRRLLVHLEEVADTHYWREHVTLYAKENLEAVGGVFLDPRPGTERPTLRLTVDTLMDYLWTQEVRRNLEGRVTVAGCGLRTLIDAASRLSSAA